MAVKHAKVSAITDDGVSTHVGTDEWNADHAGFYGIGTFEVDIDSSVILKDFDSRTVGSSVSWGNAQVGGAWVMTALGGDSRGVSGGIGSLLADAANAVPHRNGVLQFEIRTSTTPTGSNIHDIAAILRGQFDTSTNAWTAGLFAQAQISSLNVITWQFSYITGPSGGATTLSTTRSPVAWSANTWHTVKFKVVENELFIKIWRSSDPEPDWDKAVDIKTGDWNLGAGYAPLLDVGVHAGFHLIAGNGASFGPFDVKNVSLRSARPLSAGTFDVTGLSGLTAGQDVCVFQVPGPYTDGGTLADEAEMDSISATGFAVDASTLRVYWESDYPVRGNYKFGYFSPTATGVTHAYASPVADDGSLTKVGSDEWDAAHVGGPTFGQFEGNLGGGVIVKDFDSRVVASGWGTAQVGGAWTGGSSVGTGVGLIQVGDSFTNVEQLIQNVNPSLTFSFKTSGLPVSGTIALNDWMLRGYATSGPNRAGVLFSIIVATSGAISLSVGIATDSGLFLGLTVPTVETLVVSTYFSVRASVVGQDVRMKLWRSDRDEPVDAVFASTIPLLAVPGNADVRTLHPVGDLVSARFVARSALDPDAVIYPITLRDVALYDSSPATEGTFDVTGLSGLTAGKPVYVFQRAAPYSDGGTREDEAEMGIVRATGYVVDAATIRVYWKSRTPVSGRAKFAYVVVG